jgi:hypothetical protein
MLRRNVVRIAASAAVLAASASWAGYADFVARAHRAVEDAQDAAHASTPACQKAVEQKLEVSLGHLADLHQFRSPQRLQAVSAELADVGMQAVLATCPNAIADGIREGSELLDQARALRVRELTSGEEETASAPPAGVSAVMSDAEFQKVLNAVKKTKDEVSKGDAVKNALGATMVTNQQLGVLLDQMSSDVIKLDVVSAAAKRMSDSKSGPSIASHFDNEEMGRQAADTLEGRTP